MITLHNTTHHKQQVQISKPYVSCMLVEVTAVLSGLPSQKRGDRMLGSYVFGLSTGGPDW